MNLKIKYFILGFIAACVVGVGAVFCFLYFATSGSISTFHEQALSSGKTIKISMCNLVYGVEHDERYPNQDCFEIEYIAYSSNADQQTRDRETLEVFELIRPISEQWGFAKAVVVAFPTAKRKGIYYIYTFRCDAERKWTFTQNSAKVHIND